MNANRLWGFLLAAGVSVAVTAMPTDALAQGKAKGSTKTQTKSASSAPTNPMEAPSTKKPVKIDPGGIGWGMSPKQLADFYDKVLDEDFKPKYKETSPGIQQKNLDAELAEEKSAFRRSRIDFGKLPTGVDSTPLRGEYSYQNKESMMSITRNGDTRYFFFIGDRLWKIIGEHKLGADSAYGKDWKDSQAKFTGFFGGGGRTLQADADKGRYATEIDWKDTQTGTHIRLIQRSDEAIGIAFEDAQTASNIASLRPNKPVQDDGVDPAVKSALMGKSDSTAPDANAKGGKDAKDAKKGGKGAGTSNKKTSGKTDAPAQ